MSGNAAASDKPEKPSPYIETNAMAIAYNALAALDQSGQRRALRWLSDRLDEDHPANADPWNTEPPF